MKFILGILLIVFTAASCGSSKEEVMKKKEIQNSLSGTYTIEKLDTKVDLPKKLTITFDSKSNNVSGFSGCNTFFSDYILEGNSITFGNIASSKKYCPGEANKIEARVYDILKGSNTILVNENSIKLKKDDITLLSATKQENEEKSKQVGEHYYTSGITYKTTGRGSFEYINISGNKVSISNDRNLQEIKEYSCSDEDWQAVKKMIKKIDLSTLHHLKAPTDQRLHDGAAHATLAIRTGDMEAMSSSFDHGNPPKQIEALVNKVLSIKESVVKQ